MGAKMTETTVLDFKLSNSFEEYKAYMLAPEQQKMFSEMGVEIFISAQQRVIQKERR